MATDDTPKASTAAVILWFVVNFIIAMGSVKAVWTFGVAYVNVMQFLQVVIMFFTAQILKELFPKRP